MEGDHITFRQSCYLYLLPPPKNGAGKAIPISILSILLILSNLNCVYRRYRLANTPPEKRKYLRKSQLWSEGFTAKLFFNVELWVEHLAKLIEQQPEFERPAAVGRSLLPRPR